MDNDYNQYNEYNNLNEFNEQPVEMPEYNDIPYEDVPPVPMISFGGLPPAIEAVKACGQSVPFLIAAIGVTISVLITLINAISSGAVGMELSAMMLAEESAAAQAAAGIAYMASYLMSMILALCPMILLMIGMWVIYGSSKKFTPMLKGIGACRAAIIIWDVCMWIVLVFTVIFGAVLVAASGIIGEELSYYFYTDVTKIVIGVIAGVVVVLLIYEILALLYVTKMLKTTRVVKDIFTYGVSKKKVSIYLIVINFLIAIGGVFSLLLSASLPIVVAYLPEFLYEMGISIPELNMALSQLEGVAGVTGVNAIPQILGIVTIICINIVLIKLRSKLKQIFMY